MAEEHCAHRFIFTQPYSDASMAAYSRLYVCDLSTALTFKLYEAVLYGRVEVKPYGRFLPPECVRLYLIGLRSDPPTLDGLKRT